MEFTVTKKLLSPILERLVYVVANERQAYDKLDYLSIKAENDKLMLATSNGYIKALFTLVNGESLSINSPGDAVVSVKRMRDIVDAAGDEDRLDIKSDGKTNLSRNIIGQKRSIKIQVIPEPADVELKKVNSKVNFQISSNLFCDCVDQIIPWAGVEEYKQKYKQMYMEFKKEETRFVCGDGEKFAVIINRDNSNTEKFENNEKSNGYIIPAEQAKILSRLFSDTTSINMIFGQTTYLFKSDNIQVIIDGIPIDYINYLPYNKQIERLSSRKFSAQISGTIYSSLVQDMESIRDSEYEKRRGCIPLNINLSSSGLSCKTNFHNVFESSIELDKFESFAQEKELSDDYAIGLFSDVLKFGNSNCYEFSFMGKDDLVFCKFLDDPEESKRIIFFAPVAESN
ncbi:MAG: hypothetical protein WC755_01985 [Candidatus Woesearchaeota archaeon]|jgi:DNA polymerase III sliding clamp (beta) subunit (PCNA family)